MQVYLLNHELEQTLLPHIKYIYVCITGFQKGNIFKETQNFKIFHTAKLKSTCNNVYCISKNFFRIKIIKSETLTVKFANFKNYAF